MSEREVRISEWYCQECGSEMPEGVCDCGSEDIFSREKLHLDKIYDIDTTPSETQIAYWKEVEKALEQAIAEIEERIAKFKKRIKEYKDEYDDTNDIELLDVADAFHVAIVQLEWVLEILKGE